MPSAAVMSDSLLGHSIPKRGTSAPLLILTEDVFFRKIRIIPTKLQI